VGVKITKSADFAMRIVLFLADEQQSYTMPQLSEKLVIPYNNLSKLVQALNKAGILQTKQGKNGGVKLFKSANDISLKSILDVIDGPTRLSDCLSDQHFCTLNNTCRLKGALNDIQTQIDALLCDATLQKIMERTTHEPITA
jgi:Rrf2 family protein